MFDNNNVFVGPGERGSGNVVTQTRNVSDFSSLEVSYPAQVLVRQGTQESLKIEAEDNLMPNLKTEVRNGTLRIFYRREDGKHVNPTKTPKITVTVKDLKDVEFNSAGELVVQKLKSDKLDISLSGAGNVELEDIQTPALSVSLSGAGSATASGTADDLQLNISGFGDFKGGDLHSKSARVDISGAGSATVWADDELSAGISGAGSVNYYGSPTVDRRISGVGGIDSLGDK
jgi:hypothetical protein